MKLACFKMTDLCLPKAPAGGEASSTSYIGKPFKGEQGRSQVAILSSTPSSLFLTACPTS